MPIESIALEALVPTLDSINLMRVGKRQILLAFPRQRATGIEGLRTQQKIIVNIAR